ncbi:MAG: sulfatase-like hydrolase/transferase [Treponema sp.]|nr:sulfatase-like hydrolase/transferase [Treponema sp.]
MNILLIMADQFRGDWMSCRGTDFVRTPHIDEIARGGVRFPGTVCNSPLCAPSRASIAAGVYPHRTGVMSNDKNFPTARNTYYRVLREHGYRVSVIGKSDLHKPDHFYGKNGDLPLMYHLGFTDSLDTEGKMNSCKKRGCLSEADCRFDTYSRDADIPEGLLAGPYQHYLREKGLLLDFSRDYYKRLFEKPVWHSGVSVLSADDCHDSFIGRNACEYLENVSDESPWHLFVSFAGPHDPWDAPKEYYERYKDVRFEDFAQTAPEHGPALSGNSGKGKPGWVQRRIHAESEGMGAQDLLEVKRHYAAAISLIDDWIGKMLAVLDSRGLRDNTAIIFCSDHGEILGEHGLFTKSCMYEGALRVPLIMSVPGATGGRTENGMAELVDLYPSILDMAGIDFDKEGLDGISLLPVITGNEKIPRNFQYSELNNTRMISDGNYKLIDSLNDISELYDLKKDPCELSNILADNKAIARSLRKKMNEICK